MLKDVRSGSDIYKYAFDPASDEAAANVLRFVGQRREVLELGAGPGSISKPLKELNGCTVTAVERDEESAAILEGFCHDVHRLDLNNPDWPEPLSGRQYDTIVIADVLEHLYDPWTALNLAVPLLKNDGNFVVSLPHAGHAAILACLFNNDLEYREWGLLDRTHIRFFGMKNIQALFEGAGLKIVDFAFVIKNPEKTELAAHWGRIPSHAQAALLSADFSNVFQVVVRAERAELHPALPGKVLFDHPQPQQHKLKLIAFYLPQFHPIPENDQWWGKGFTEWTNTAKAQPVFRDHYQPHVPADLGFYDLRTREVQHQQIALAKQYGIDAFCFHYYWFGGRRLLEKPINDFLNDSQANIEFCLCWANENWTRTWTGGDDQILVKQDYYPGWETAFIQDLLPYLKDRRYLRIDGKPAIVIYRPQQIPERKAVVSFWRDYCRQNGIGEIHLIAALTHDNAPHRSDFKFEEYGFDSGLEFPPHGVKAPNRSKELTNSQASYVAGYEEVAASYLNQDYKHRRVFRGVVPSWDNTARKPKGMFIICDARPETYESWLDAAAAKTLVERNPNERLIFINAWNEWAEGCHLEPDLKFGKGYLEATHRVKTRKSFAEPISRAPRSPRGQSPVQSLGLRVELALWCQRRLRHIPGVYPAARALYRRFLRRPA